MKNSKKRWQLIKKQLNVNVQLRKQTKQKLEKKRIGFEE